VRGNQRRITATLLKKEGVWVDASQLKKRQPKTKREKGRRLKRDVYKFVYDFLSNTMDDSDLITEMESLGWYDTAKILSVSGAVLNEILSKSDRADSLR